MASLHLPPARAQAGAREQGVLPQVLGFFCGSVELGSHDRIVGIGLHWFLMFEPLVFIERLAAGSSSK